MLALLGFIILLGVFISMVVVALHFVKKNDPERLDTSQSGRIETAQEFLPFLDVRDQMILMGNNNYHAVIEVSSVNYALRNDREKDIIELSFQSLLNSLTHPITLFISTREMDYTQLVEAMKVDYEKSYQEFPDMRDYLQQNLIDMQQLSTSLGETRHKKKYVIIPYDANVLSELTDEEKYEAATEVLFERALNIQDGLERISGLNTKILDTIEIMDLLVQSYHRDGSRFAEDLFNGKLTSLIVDSDDVARPDEFSDEELFDHMLNEMQATLESKFLHNDTMDRDMKIKAQEMWERIHTVRQSDEIDGFKVNHEQEKRNEFSEKIKRGEVTTFGNNRRFENNQEAKRDEESERL